MQLRPLGRSGLQVAPLAFGGNVFGQTADTAISFALLGARLAHPGALDAAAQANKATPAQVALAWQIARPGIAAPIASTASPAQLHELAAAALQLPAATIAALGQASR